MWRPRPRPPAAYRQPAPGRLPFPQNTAQYPPPPPQYQPPYEPAYPPPPPPNQPYIIPPQPFPFHPPPPLQPNQPYIFPQYPPLPPGPPPSPPPPPPPPEDQSPSPPPPEEQPREVLRVACTFPNPYYVWNGRRIRKHNKNVQFLPLSERGQLKIHFIVHYSGAVAPDTTLVFDLGSLMVLGSRLVNCWPKLSNIKDFQSNWKEQFEEKMANQSTFSCFGTFEFACNFAERYNLSTLADNIKRDLAEQEKRGAFPPGPVHGGFKSAPARNILLAVRNVLGGDICAIIQAEKAVQGQKTLYQLHFLVHPDLSPAQGNFMPNVPIYGNTVVV